jgi:hypothetical protein
MDPLLAKENFDDFVLILPSGVECSKQNAHLISHLNKQTLQHLHFNLKECLVGFR